jgi:hypothetical protein
MKRLIFVGALFCMATSAFAQAQRDTDIVDVNANASMGAIEGLLNDGRVYELGFTVDYTEKTDLVFGFGPAEEDDPCPDRGVCAYAFEQAYDPNFADGDFSSFECYETVLGNRDYKMLAPNSADVTFPSVLLGEDLNARFTRTGDVTHDTFRNQIVRPDGFGIIEISNEGFRNAEAYVELTGLGSGSTHSSNGFLSRGHFRVLNTILPAN